jgi:uncharacterized protein (TIGR02246 family)
MKTTFAALLMACTVLLAACAPSGPTYDPAADRAAIEAASTVWAESFNSGNAAGIAALHTADAVIYPPNAKPVSGKDAIQAFWQGLIDTGIKAELEVEEVSVGGDLASKVGAFKIITPSGEVADEGHFIEIWTRVEGEWRFHRDIWNSDRSPAPPAEVADES